MERLNRRNAKKRVVNMFITDTIDTVAKE